MKRTIIGILLVTILFFLIVCLLPTLKDSECIWNNELKKIKLNGVVTKKYIDSTNHSFPFLEIKQFVSDTVIKVGLVGDTSNAYNIISVGDTIAKTKGSNLILLQNSQGKTVVKIDFGCNKKE